MAGRIPKPWFWEAKGAWYVHLDGERVDLGKDEVAAHRRLHRLMANRGLEEALNPTVAELAEQYLAELPRRANARTVYVARCYLKPFLAACGEHTTRTLKKHHVEATIRETWNATTEHHVKSRIVALFNWGVEQGLISTNPVKGIRKPQLKSRGSQAVIDDGELERLMSAAPAYLRNVLIALQQSGARPCEVLTVEAKNFVDNLWILDKHKTSRITGKPRIIYLTPALVELCKELVVTIRLFRGTVRTPGFSGSFLFAVRAYSFFSDAALVPHPNATLFLPSGSAMASVTIDTDLPPGGTLPAYQRHGFEVSWPWPARCRCDSCRKEDDAHLEVKDSVQVVRDLDIWGQPSFWINPTAFHRCPWCHHRQHLLPPFKRKDTSYTSRFEQQVLRLLIGSNEEEVVRRLALAAETVGLIVKNQLADAKAKQVDPQRVITDVSIDELSLKQRHKLDVTILTDLTNPDWPEVLAVAAGRDEAAGRQCLEKLSEEQRL
jgi:integrase